MAVLPLEMDSTPATSTVRPRCQWRRPLFFETSTQSNSSRSVHTRGARPTPALRPAFGGRAARRNGANILGQRAVVLQSTQTFDHRASEPSDYHELLHSALVVLFHSFDLSSEGSI